MKNIIVFISLLMLVACVGNRVGETVEGTSVEMRHASLLSMRSTGSEELQETEEGVINVEIKNPWDTTAVLHRYQLGGAQGLKLPLKKVVVYTSVHCALICEMGAGDAIAGVCDSKYITQETVKKGIEEGRVVDLLEGTAPNIEKIIDLNPDAILLSPFQNSGSYGRLGKLGIPIIECADYMETSALGRAEWMRFYGMLFGKQEFADSLFAAIESRYDSLKACVADVKEKPTMFADMKFGSSWYVAGANSTQGMLYKDAGADYVFKDEKASGSVPYDPEVVFDRAQDADIWVLKYNQATDKTLSEIAADYPNYARMKAFTTGNVYGCNTAYSRFYEETPFHPDLLLADYIRIFHPEKAGWELRYFKLMR